MERKELSYFKVPTKTKLRTKVKGLKESYQEKESKIGK